MTGPSAPNTEDSRPAILLVDDNEVHRYALNRALQHADFEVFVAHTGTEALEIAQRHRLDVVLLDINLPDVNGFEVCARLKVDPSTKSLPVVFHSATSATVAAQTYAESLGATSFLTYPIDIEHLLAVVRGAIARSSQK